MWEVHYHPKVVNDLDYLGKAAATRILKIIDECIVHGSPDQLVKPLRNELAGCRRIKTGDNRIVYQVNVKKHRISILAVGPRRDEAVYKRTRKRMT